APKRIQGAETLLRVVDAVLQGREVLVTHGGEPLGTIGLHRFGPARGAPRALLEAAVRDGFDVLAEEVRNRDHLPSWLLN
ncbi:MAG TPA: hypothetical protein VFR37_17280, partial [Longimicrobium sp.]|nr:hypothetical protein [Longimicrobium sp.]